MAEFTDEQWKVFQITESLKNPPVRDHGLKKVAHGLKERLGIGGYTTRPHIEGRVGGEFRY